MSAEAPLLAGRYLLGAQIGAGGMGAVHRATDTRLSREVAVKVLPAEALGDSGARERLMREALACAALQHPGIVHVYDVGETDDGGAYLVMELVAGVSLRALVHDAEWSSRARVTAVAEAARALGAAHRAGLIHRDVKPDNLMLREDGRVVLLDFGIAKPTEADGAATLTGTGAIVGTPAYLSPEQARGLPLDARTDQFSLAVTAYELLTHERPWISTTAMAVVAAILADPPPRLTLDDAALADALRPVLERALAKSPDDRFPDCDALADALSSAAGLATAPNAGRAGLSSGPSGGLHTPEAYEATALASPTPAARALASPEPAGPPPRRGGRRRALLAAAGLALVAAATTAGLAWRATRSPLDVPVPVLACPMLEALVDGKPAPWLGAAAAYALADSVAPVLGGFDHHVRYPAALLGMPGYDPEARDLDPWAAPGLRERALQAASRTGEAWLDGRIEAHGVQLSITAIVRAPSGRELGRASGSGVGLAAVVLELSRELRAAGALGGLHPLDADFRAFEAIATQEELDAVEDLLRARSGTAPESWCKLELPQHLPAAWRMSVDHWCDRGPLDLSAPLDPISEGLAGSQDLTPELAARIEREEAEAPPGERKAHLLQWKLGMRLQAGPEAGDARALSLASMAVDPRVGWRGQATAIDPLFGGTSDPAYVANALLWSPDADERWQAAARASEASDRGRVSELLGHAFVLSPARSSARYADALVRDGNTERASVVAAFLMGREGPAPRDEGAVLASQAELAAGSFGRVLARWTEELSTAKDLFQERSDNVRISGLRELAYLLGRERPSANPVARALVDGRVATRISPNNPTARPNLAALCALSEPSLATACLTKLRADEAGEFQRDDWHRMLDVAERYVAGDFAKAAETARPLLRAPFFALRTSDFLVDVFDRGGLPEMAEELDRPRADDRNLHGASLATLRSARRAWARSDKDRARALAKRVVDAWKVVDVTVPAVAEMEALLATK